MSWNINKILVSLLLTANIPVWSYPIPYSLTNQLIFNFDFSGATLPTQIRAIQFISDAATTSTDLQLTLYNDFNGLGSSLNVPIYPWTYSRGVLGFATSPSIITDGKFSVGLYDPTGKANLSNFSAYGYAYTDRLYPTPSITYPIGNQTTTFINPLGSRVPGLNNTAALSFDGKEFTYRMNIGLNGYRASNSILSLWESGIEDTWSKQIYIDNHGIHFPLVVDVNFSYELTNPDAVVNVVYAGLQDSCRSDVFNWCSLGQRNTFEDLPFTAAHEFGHLIGLYDEYLGGSTDPFASSSSLCESVLGFNYGLYCGDLMASIGGKMEDRYFDGLVNFIKNSAEMPNAVFGHTPIYGQYLSDSPFIADEPTPRIQSSVPEPGTPAIVGIALLIVIILMRRKRSAKFREERTLLVWS